MPTIKRLAADQLAADADTAPDMPDDATWRVVRRPAVPDVRQVRARLGLSQAAFADRFGLSTRTVQEWEQGRAVPDQPAGVLLKVILDAPETVARAVRASYSAFQVTSTCRREPEPAGLIGDAPWTADAASR